MARFDQLRDTMHNDALLRDRVVNKSPVGHAPSCRGDVKTSSMEITDFWPLTLLLMCSLVVGQIPEPIDSRQSLETSRSSEGSDEEVEDKDYGSVSSAPSSTPASLVRSTPTTSKDGDLSKVLDDNFHMFRKRRSAEEEEEEEFEQESFVKPVLNYQQMILDSQELQGIREKLKQIKTVQTDDEADATSPKKFSFFGIVERIYFNNLNSTNIQTITYSGDSSI